MEPIEKALKYTFVVLFGVLFSGVFVLLALETAIRRSREDRMAALEPPDSEIEAAYRARPKTRPTTERRALPPVTAG